MPMGSPPRPVEPAVVNTPIISRQPMLRRSAASELDKCLATNCDNFFGPPPRRWKSSAIIFGRASGSLLRAMSITHHA